MTTRFKQGGKDYIVIISSATEDYGTKRVDGIAEVFIGFDPKPRFREGLLNMMLYKKTGEQVAAPDGE